MEKVESEEVYMKIKFKRYSIGARVKKIFNLGRLRVFTNKLSSITSLVVLIATTNGRAANPYSDGFSSNGENIHWKTIQFTEVVGDFERTLDLFRSLSQSSRSDSDYSFSTQSIPELGNPVEVIFKSRSCIRNQLEIAIGLGLGLDRKSKTIKLELSFDNLFGMPQEGDQIQLKTTEHKAVFVIEETDKDQKGQASYKKDISECVFTISVDKNLQ